MACGARSGLKLCEPGECSRWSLRLNGLWSPFGIETGYLFLVDQDFSPAKWPVEPVRD